MYYLHLLLFLFFILQKSPLDIWTFVDYSQIEACFKSYTFFINLILDIVSLVLTKKLNNQTA